MRVYRITGKKHAKDISGTGAANYGGRWNRKGMPVLYTGESKEIALLETIVHIPPMFLPKLSILTIEIPDCLVKEISIDILPKNGTNYPAPTVLSEIAEKVFIESEKLALKVPSSIIHTSNNIILNCNHKAFNKEVRIISTKDFYYDKRLMK